MGVPSHLIYFLSNIGKSSFNHPIFIFVRHAHRLSEFRARLEESITPFEQIRCPFNTLVIAVDSDDGVRNFKPSSRFQVIERLTE